MELACQAVVLFNCSKRGRGNALVTWYRGRREPPSVRSSEKSSEKEQGNDESCSCKADRATDESRKDYCFEGFLFHLTSFCFFLYFRKICREKKKFLHFLIKTPLSELSLPALPHSALSQRTWEERKRDREKDKQNKTPWFPYPFSQGLTKDSRDSRSSKFSWVPITPWFT